jgi:transcriptional antiterminator RfaH
MTMERWYCLHTKPKKERQVDEILRNQGITTYLPTRHEIKKRHLVATGEPLFPRYLFAQVDLPKVGISAIAYTPGLTSMVSFCGEPAVVADEIIEYLQQREEKGTGPEVYGRFLPGERVVVKTGPVKGIEAVFDSRLSGTGRVRILLKILGQQTPAEVSEDWLEKVA